MPRRNFWIFSLQDCQKMAFPHLFTSEIFSKQYLQYSKLKQWENLIIELQPCLQGFFLLYLYSTCLNDRIVIKIKKPFTFSFFSKRFFIFDSVQIWQSKLQHTPQEVESCLVYIKNKHWHLLLLKRWFNFWVKH